MINNRIIDSFLRCKKKAFLIHKNETGEDSEFNILEDELYKLNKDNFLNKIKENPNIQLFPNLELSKKNLIKKKGYVVNQSFQNNTYKIKFDAIELTRLKPSSKDISFVPISIFPQEKILKPDKISFVIKAILVSEFRPISFQAGKILYGKELKKTKVNLKIYSEEAKKYLIKLRKIIKDDDPPRFFLNSHCQVCPYHKLCKTILDEKDDLSLLGRVTEKVILKLNNRGIFTVNQLSYTYRPKKFINPNRYNYALKALALREKQTYLIQLPNLPISANEIYFDFEGLPDENFIYLIGLLIVKENIIEQQLSFWANSKEDEEKIFKRLFTIISEYNDFTIYHYGNYEIRCLKKFNKKSKSSYQGEIAHIVDHSINILSFFSATIYPPTFSNSLKDIAVFLGFKWKSEKASGIQSIYWRKRWELSNNIDFKENLVQYNIDDCIALKLVKDWLMHIGTKKNGLIKVEDIPPVGSFPYKFAIFRSSVSDFERINKCAYFDYQRKKIYLKTNANIAKAIKRENKRIKSVNKINKIYLVPPLKKCPQCGHDKLHKHSKESHKNIDLRLSKNGIKKWIVLFKGQRSFCCRCQKASKPKELKGIPRYGHDLASWATNQNISYKTPLNVVLRTLSESFSIDVPHSSLRYLRSKLSHNLEGVYEEISHNVLNSPFIHADETTVKVKGFSSPYVWVFTNMETVFYLFRPNREADFLKDFLKDYEGVLISDFYPGFESLPCSQQKCIIHLMRDLNEDLLKNPFDIEYEGIVVQFGKLLNIIVNTIEIYGLKKRHLHKHKKDADRFYKTISKKQYESELAESYQKRFIKNRNTLFTILDYDNVTWNNNNAKHAIIPFAKYRTIRTVEFTEKNISEYLLLLSIQQTCVYRGISFLEFLKSQEISIEKYTKNH